MARAGFKPIWPISSNRAPCQRGPRAPPTTTQTYTFYGTCSCIAPARSPVFFKSLWETKTIIKFFQQSPKIQHKFALLPPSSYTKTLIYIHLGIQMKQLRSLKKSLQRAWSKLEQTLEVPTVFFKRGIPCLRKSKWTARFLTLSSKFYSKNGHCFQWWVPNFFFTSTLLRQRGIRFLSCFLFYLQKRFLFGRSGFNSCCKIQFDSCWMSIFQYLLLFVFWGYRLFRNCKCVLLSLLIALFIFTLIKIWWGNMRLA